MDPEDFRKRQQADYQRYTDGDPVVRRKPFHERYEYLANGQRDGHTEDDDLPDSDDESHVSFPMNGAAGTGDEGEEA